MGALCSRSRSCIDNFFLKKLFFCGLALPYRRGEGGEGAASLSPLLLDCIVAFSHCGGVIRATKKADTVREGVISTSADSGTHPLRIAYKVISINLF